MCANQDSTSLMIIHVHLATLHAKNALGRIHNKTANHVLQVSKCISGMGHVSTKGSATFLARAVRWDLLNAIHAKMAILWGMEVAQSALMDAKPVTITRCCASCVMMATILHPMVHANCATWLVTHVLDQHSTAQAATKVSIWIWLTWDATQTRPVLTWTTNLPSGIMRQTNACSVRLLIVSVV